MSKNIIQGRFDLKGKNSLESRPIFAPHASNGGDKSDDIIKGIESRPISTQSPNTGTSQSSGNNQSVSKPQQDSSPNDSPKK